MPMRYSWQQDRYFENRENYGVFIVGNTPYLHIFNTYLFDYELI